MYLESPSLLWLESETSSSSSLTGLWFLLQQGFKNITTVYSRQGQGQDGHGHQGIPVIRIMINLQYLIVSSMSRLACRMLSWAGPKEGEIKCKQL